MTATTSRQRRLARAWEDLLFGVLTGHPTRLRPAYRRIRGRRPAARRGARLPRHPPRADHPGRGRPAGLRRAAPGVRPAPRGAGDALGAVAWSTTRGWSAATCAASPSPCSRRWPGRCGSARPSARTSTTWPAPPTPPRAAVGVRGTAAGPPGVQRILDAMTAPALVSNARMDYLAANRVGRALYAPLFDSPVGTNAARFLLLDPRGAEFYPDWDQAVDDVVALLRTQAGRSPVRQGPHRPHRRAVHPQRDLPHPVGPARRPPAPDRHQAAAPPRRRRPRPAVRDDGAARRPGPRAAALHRRARLGDRAGADLPRQLGGCSGPAGPGT